jgi:putative heme-binding domain-containing protein
VALQVNIDLPLAETRLVDEVPLRGDFGLPEARIIVPGVPSRSVLLHRLLRHGSGRMPVLGSREPDPEGIRRLRDWIAGMPGGEAEPEEPVSRDRAPGDVREAMRLVLSLDAAGPEGADPGRVPAVAAAWRSGDANVRELFERFRPAGERAATVGTSPDEAALAALPGDAARGRALVAPEGKLAVCLTCHVVEGRGRDFGPDLAAAGARLDRRALLAGLLRPSETVEPAYRGVEVETRDGKVRAGFVVRRDAGGVVLKLPDGRTEDIPAGTVRRERWWSESLMPEGLLAGVTPQDAADLLAYLAALGAAAGR